jgi:hypothetical protein
VVAVVHNGVLFQDMRAALEEHSGRAALGPELGRIECGNVHGRRTYNTWTIEQRGPGRTGCHHGDAQGARSLGSSGPRSTQRRGSPSGGRGSLTTTTLAITKSGKKHIIPLGLFGEEVPRRGRQQRAEWGERGEWVVSYTNGDLSFGGRRLTYDFGVRASA